MGMRGLACVINSQPCYTTPEYFFYPRYRPFILRESTCTSISAAVLTVLPAIISHKKRSIDVGSQWPTKNSKNSQRDCLAQTACYMHARFICIAVYHTEAVANEKSLREANTTAAAAAVVQQCRTRKVRSI